MTARLQGETIEDLSLSGDFTFHPAPLLPQLEAALRGRRLEHDELTSVIGEFYSSSGVQAPGLTPEEIAEALLKLSKDAPHP